MKRNYPIKDKYVKVRKIDNKWYVVHLFTDKILYNPYTGERNKNLSNYSFNRIKEQIDGLLNLQK